MQVWSAYVAPQGVCAEAHAPDAIDYDWKPWVTSRRRLMPWECPVTAESTWQYRQRIEQPSLSDYQQWLRVNWRFTVMRERYAQLDWDGVLEELIVASAAVLRIGSDPTDSLRALMWHGGTLSERDLADNLAVPRSQLRELFQPWASHGLVKLRQRRRSAVWYFDGTQFEARLHEIRDAMLQQACEATRRQEEDYMFRCEFADTSCVQGRVRYPHVEATRLGMRCPSCRVVLGMVVRDRKEWPIERCARRVRKMFLLLMEAGRRRRVVERIRDAAASWRAGIVEPTFVRPPVERLWCAFLSVCVRVRLTLSLSLSLCSD